MTSIAPDATVLLVSPAGTDPDLLTILRCAAARFPRLGVTAAPSVAAAHDRLWQPGLALIVAHVAGPDAPAALTPLVEAAAALSRPVGVVAVGEAGRAADGLALLRAGAADFLERPLDLRRLGLLLDVLTVRARLAPAPAAAPAAPEVVEQPAGDGTFLYCPTALMGRVMDQVRRVAPTDTNVLIQGETGTGKTRLARVIHDLSPRKGKPFLVVNCAALSATLIESELFGHVKGAFTGADRDRVGKFAAAADGTLFLDEIDSLPPAVQAKLLRVIEDRVFEPVGSNAPAPVRARLVAAGNRPLAREVEAGRFRSDLFFRLNVVTFEVPPLRDRPEVFGPMAVRFLKEMAEKAGRPIGGFAPEATAAMAAYPWPGNVRELRNAVERAVALRPAGLIELDDLPDAVRGVPAERPSQAMQETLVMPALATVRGEPAAARPVPAPSPRLSETKAGAEAEAIAASLRKNRNNRSRVAAELGISRETLYKKLHRYGLFETSR